MITLTKIRSFFSEMDQGEFRTFSLMYILGFLICSGLLLFFYISQEASVLTKINELNKSRREIQKTLTDYQRVAQQKNFVTNLCLKMKLFICNNLFKVQFKQLEFQIAQLERYHLKY